jgi:hypothetical protein
MCPENNRTWRGNFTVWLPEAGDLAIIDPSDHRSKRLSIQKIIDPKDYRSKRLLVQEKQES